MVDSVLDDGVVLAVVVSDVVVADVVLLDGPGVVLSSPPISSPMP